MLRKCVDGVKLQSKIHSEELRGRVTIQEDDEDVSDQDPFYHLLESFVEVVVGIFSQWITEDLFLRLDIRTPKNTKQKCQP